MASNTLELLRSNLELSEKYELAIGEELDIKPSGVRLCLRTVLNVSHLNFIYSKKQKFGNSMFSINLEIKLFT